MRALGHLRSMTNRTLDRIPASTVRESGQKRGFIMVEETTIETLGGIAERNGGPSSGPAAVIAGLAEFCYRKAAQLRTKQDSISRETAKEWLETALTLDRPIRTLQNKVTRKLAKN
jgi:hypothetical protein